MARTFETIFKLAGKLDPSVQRVLDQANNKAVKSAQKISQGVSDKFAGMAKKVMGVMAAVYSVRAVINFGKEAVQAAEEEVIAQNKLLEVMRQRMNASEADAEAIMDLASAQQRLGVIGDEVQIAGAQQLATFLTQKESLEKLLPAMNNLAAQQKGLGATQEDLVNIGNMMGKVMQGQVGALRRVGVTFTAAEEKVLKYGNESERAAMLAQVITNNVGNMNAVLAQTDFGKYTQAKNVISDLKETFGKQLVPIVADAAQRFLPLLEKAFGWLQKSIKSATPFIERFIGFFVSLGEKYLPRLLRLHDKIFSIFGKIFDLLAPLTDKLLELIFDAIEPLVEAYMPLIEAVLPPLATLLSTVMDIIKPFMPILTELVKGIIRPIVDLIQRLNPLFEALLPILSGIGQVLADYIGPILKELMPILEPILDILKSIIEFLTNVFTGDWAAAWQNIVNIFTTAWDAIVNAVRFAVNLVIDVINSLIWVYNSTIGELGGVIGVDIKLKPIERLAAGATVTQPTFALIGEGPDPETVVPHNNNPRSVALLQEAAAGVGVPIGGTVMNNFYYQPVVPATANIEEVKQVLDDDFNRWREYMQRYVRDEGRLAFA